MKYLKFFVPLLLLILLSVFLSDNVSEAIFKTSSDTIYNKQYYRLNKILDKYESIKNEGGWPSISFAANNMDSAQIRLIMKRLIIGGDIDSTNIVAKADSAIIREGIRNFQVRHGLDITGELNKTTLEQLNISVEERIEQLKLNAERWKNLPVDTIKNYIVVNIPDYKLNVVENDSVVLSMKVIVGRIYRSTPVFDATMTHIVFNPEWIIPPTIFKYDILPLIIKDTAYLRKENIHVMERKTGKDKLEINADSINWESINPHTFPYDLVKASGPENPMGKIKFMFPNKHNVYFHDTPAKQLFNSQDYTLSSGCIRLSDAKSLAYYILAKQGYTLKQLERMISSEKTTQINIKYPLPVYIQYITAWTDDYGKVYFRKDIYNRDSL